MPEHLSTRPADPRPIPNVVLILADDLGFSDIGCYGSEIHTPNLDQLAGQGVRLTQFHNTARCSPSRASLLTGVHPHQAGIGILTQDDGPVGYPGTLSERCATMAEILGNAGYRTHLAGKWHLVADRRTPNAGWPTRRGFDTFFGTLTGCGSYFDPGTLTRGEEPADDAKDPGYYYTDAIGDDAVQFIEDQDGSRPFFCYVAFSAPHWPLHAKPADADAYRGMYDDGWDVLRSRRFGRQMELGVVPANTRLSDRDPEVPAWEDETDPTWQASRMEVYAAQVDAMDQNIGRILQVLEQRGLRSETIVIFLSDNGASYEELPMGEADWFKARADIFPGVTRAGDDIDLGNHPSVTPGPENTYCSYGRGWANVSNTPYRMFKEWVHEGGIASPFIVSWPEGEVRSDALLDLPLQLVDVLPTILDATGIDHPSGQSDTTLISPVGRSFLPALRHGGGEARPMFWEHVGNAAVRVGRWKLVRGAHAPWELYDVGDDPAELIDVSVGHPDIVGELSTRWDDWAKQNGVVAWDKIVASYEARGLSEFNAKGS